MLYPDNATVEQKEALEKLRKRLLAEKENRYKIVD